MSFSSSSISSRPFLHLKQLLSFICLLLLLFLSSLSSSSSSSSFSSIPLSLSVSPVHAITIFFTAVSFFLPKPFTINAGLQANCQLIISAKPRYSNTAGHHVIATCEVASFNNNHHSNKHISQHMSNNFYEPIPVPSPASVALSSLLPVFLSLVPSLAQLSGPSSSTCCCHGYTRACECTCNCAIVGRDGMTFTLNVLQCEYTDYLNTFIHDHVCAHNEYNYIACIVVLEDVAHIHFARRPMYEHAAAVVLV
jgi:hypothetical protein